MSTANPFQERYKKLSNTELLKITSMPENYQPLAVDTATAELEARNLTSEELEASACLNDAEYQAKIQKKEQNFLYKLRTGNVGATVSDTLNPIQYGPVSTQRLILRLCLILAFLSVYNFCRHYALLYYEIRYSKASIIKRIIPLVVYLFPFSAILLFWLRKQMGWILLSAFFSFTAINTILMIYLTLKATAANPAVDSLIPGVNIVSLLLVGVFIGGCMYLIYKPAMRQIYRVDRSAIILAVFYGIILVGLGLI